MSMKITFPGGKKVYAHYNGHTVETDQPVREGGDGSAPEPFSHFLTSIGTCAGIYVLSFCKERKIDTEGLTIDMDFKMHPKTFMIEDIDLKINLPEGFPEKYRNAVIKTANLCHVKKHLENPPKIRVLA